MSEEKFSKDYIFHDIFNKLEDFLPGATTESDRLAQTVKEQRATIARLKEQNNLLRGDVLYGDVHRFSGRIQACIPDTQPSIPQIVKKGEPTPTVRFRFQISAPPGKVRVFEFLTDDKVLFVEINNDGSRGVQVVRDLAEEEGLVYFAPQLMFGQIGEIPAGAFNVQDMTHRLSIEAQKPGLYIRSATPEEHTQHIQLNRTPKASPQANILLGHTPDK